MSCDNSGSAQQDGERLYGLEHIMLEELEVSLANDQLISGNQLNSSPCSMSSVIQQVKNLHDDRSSPPIAVLLDGGYLSINDHVPFMRDILDTDNVVHINMSQTIVGLALYDDNTLTWYVFADGELEDIDTRFKTVCDLFGTDTFIIDHYDNHSICIPYSKRLELQTSSRAIYCTMAYMRLFVIDVKCNLYLFTTSGLPLWTISLPQRGVVRGVHQSGKYIIVLWEGEDGVMQTDELKIKSKRPPTYKEGVKLDLTEDDFTPIVYPKRDIKSA